MLLVCLLLWCSAVYGAPADSTVPPGDPPPAREARSGLVRDTAWWSAPEPEWRSRVTSQQSAIRQAVPSNLNTRTLRFVASGVGDFQPSAPVDHGRDYRFEPYYRQDLSAYDRTRDRDFYDSPRYVDVPRAAIPRRIIYYDDLGNRGKSPYYYPQQQQQPQPQQSYDPYNRYSNVRSPNIAISPYRYNPNPVEQVRGANSIVSEGTVENAPLLDDPYRNYNPRQPAPWSVQVGTSLTVKDDGRHAGRRYYVQSQREEPTLARSLSLTHSRNGNSPMWTALQPRV